MNDKKLIDYINDERFRSNLETGLTILVAIAIVIIGNGLISGFTWDLFLSLEPYASGVSTGIASSLVMNNMITRGHFDELLDNSELSNTIDDNKNKEKELTDYDYVEWFLNDFNKNEYDGLQKTATDLQVRNLTIAIQKRKINNKNCTKLEERLRNVKQNGAVVKNYKPVSMLDLLSFETDTELKGSEKINFNPIKTQQRKLARTKITWFLASGIVAGIPITTGKDALSILAYVSIFLLLIVINGFRAYSRSRRLTKTTYHKSMSYKGDVLQKAIDDKSKYNPEPDLQIIKNKDNAYVIEEV